MPENGLKKDQEPVSDGFFEQGEKGQIPQNDDIDIESLKKRPPKVRNPFLMLLIIAGSFYLMWDMRAEISYYFRSPVPVDMGKADELNPATLKNNSYVVIKGIPDPRKAQVEDMTFGIYSTYYLYYGFMGSNMILVREKFKEIDAIKKGPSEYYDSAPKIGRLISFTKFSNREELKGMRTYFKDHFRREFPDDAWLLLDGEKPWTKIQYPLIYLLLAGFVVINLRQFYIRFFKK